jgi:hypothetical protein
MGRAVAALDAAITRCATTPCGAACPDHRADQQLRMDLSFCSTVRDGVDLARALGVGVCLECNSSFAERDPSRRSPARPTCSRTCR